jgi:glycosyltransferase involved in cell wall biosynthesis
MARIGMLAPITHPCPPPGYGPWERVAHDLTERLVADGHEVTLFATADSETRASLVATVEAPLSSVPPSERRQIEDEHIATAMGIASDGRFDVVHSHLHVHALSYAERLPCPLLTTLHGAAWDAAHYDELRQYAYLPFVSLSDRERDFMPELNYVATIPNGIRMEDFPPGRGTGGYVAFVGRLAPEKAPHLAVEVARQTGLLLRMAGVIEDRYRGYAEGVLAEGAGIVDYLGSLDRPELSLLLRDAMALVMPLEWDEPFGLVVVEALASGTPVVAWRRGAMPEIVEEGVTGYLVGDVQDAVNALSKVSAISREVCAAQARRRFSDAVMAARYGEVYDLVRSAAS